MIRFENVIFSDYEQKSSWAASGLIHGIFKETPADDHSLVIYIQLSRSVSFDVSEDEGRLIVTLSPGNENESESTQYYCVSNSFYEHQEGRWPVDIDMQPVLCSDLKNKLLISLPFETKVAAQNYLESIVSTLKEALPDAVLSVIAVSKNALPDYAADINYYQIEGRQLLIKDGSYLKTSVLLDNGRYLDSAQDGRIAFSRLYKPEQPALEQDKYLMSEQLWILNTDGLTQSVDISEFFAISKAAFSADGRYIAILDQSIENVVVYVYDFTEKTLINLGEEGFGSQTADFAWSDASNTLYAMTGNQDTKQMKSCTFSDDGSFKIEAVEEQEGGEGHVAVWRGRLFFADSVAGKVFEISETRRELTSGVDIRVQSENGSLLVLETQPSDDERVSTSLKLYDMDSGETVYITQNTDVVSFGFMKDAKVYYLDAMVEGAKEGYPYGLISYDAVRSTWEEIALCSTDEFATTASGMLYFIDYLGEVNNGFYATYKYEFQ